MTFSARSTALTANPGDFWTQITAGPSTWVCSTTGFEFNRELQQVLHGMNIPVQPSYDGVRVGSSSLTRFGSDWGDTTNRLLWLALKLNAPQALLDVIKSGGRAHLITPTMIAAAAFVIMKAHFQHATELTLGNIHVPADIVPPRWNTAPPAVSNPMLTVCAMSAPPATQSSWSDALFAAGQEAQDAAPEAPPPPAPGQPPAPPAPPRPTLTTAGPLLIPVPSAQEAATAPSVSGITPGGILAGVVVLGGLGALAAYSRKSHKEVLGERKAIVPPAPRGRGGRLAAARANPKRPSFNPKLTEWLNDRGFVSGDWPHNLPKAVLLAADSEIGNGQLLMDDGYLKRELRERTPPRSRAK